ncbi:MAG: hypothetical protein ACF8QF_14360 [Phycisphaerales bacterium]
MVCIGCAALVLLALAVGNTFSLVASLVVALATLQGLWRGGAELAGVFGAMVVGVAAGPTLGRGIEGPLASVTGAAGLLSRAIAIGVGVVAMVLISAIILGFLSKRYLKRIDWWREHDRTLGAGAGLLTGSFTAFLLAWGLLSLGPIAEAQLAAAAHSAEAAGEPPARSPVSAWVVEMSGQVRSSALGGAAAGANPLAGAEIFSLADDLVAIRRDRDATDRFLASVAVLDVENVPSLRIAMERLRDETEFVDRLEQDGFTADLALDAMRSPEILRILDETRVLDDLRPHIPALRDALRDARTEEQD